MENVHELSSPLCWLLSSTCAVLICTQLGVIKGCATLRGLARKDCAELSEGRGHGNHARARAPDRNRDLVFAT